MIVSALRSARPSLMVLGLLLVTALPLRAAESLALPPVDASIQALASSPYWQRLLHLDEAGRSRVDDERFFLASGDVDALTELTATIAAVEEPVASDPNDHPLCRYPARYRWLREQGVNVIQPDSLVCPDYRSWRQQVDAVSVTLVFPAAYMNSPSSMYGHTFLRFDPRQSESGSLWLSWALNFGANIDSDDSSLLYAYKGLFGGYPGQFNMMPYYRKIQEYNRMENRDMWEYPLNLAAEEVDQLLEHVWELKDINFDYFFFDENCSFQLLELLDLVRPVARLPQQFEWHAIPADTVKAVVAAGMTGPLRFRPANRTRFDALADGMSALERRRVGQLSEAPAQAGELLADIDQERRPLLTQAAYDYLRLQQDGGVRDTDANKRSYQLLQLINRQESLSLPAPQIPTDPVLGHDSGLLRLGAGQSEGRDFVEVGFRAAYQDLLDADEGFPKGAQLEMGEIAFRHYAQGNTKLQQFELVSIRSLPHRDLLFKPWSWQVRGGLERVNSSRQRSDKLVAQVTGGGGVARGLNDDQTTLFAMLNGRLEHNSDYRVALPAGVGLNLGVRHDFGSVQSLAEVTMMALSSGDLRRRAEFGGQYNLGRQQALRLSLYHQSSVGQGGRNSVMLEYRHHLP